MAANTARRAPLMAAAGGIYAAACYIGYNAIQKNKQDIQATDDAIRQGESFVSSRQRNERYQQVATKYDDEIGRDEMAMGINLLRRSLLYFHARGTVLEVAAGTGRNIPYYPKSTVDRVVMMDTSENMLAQARQKIRQRGPDGGKPAFACSVGDSTNLNQFPDRCFDTVVDSFGLCSFDDPVQVLKEMARVCKPD